MRIEVTLAADGPGGATSVSTAVTIDLREADWGARLVDLVGDQASEGARRLVAQVAADVPPVAPAEGVRTRFVPLSALLPNC